MKKTSLIYYLICAPAIILLASCGGDSLQNINKDWNRTIRAAHVYPINPLTQDLQPGDIFLSDTTIEDLSAWNEDSGQYIPLDHLIVRLYPTNYINFYSNSFGLGSGDAMPPKYWLTNAVDTNAWSSAPVAAFPGYTFSIQQGGALNVALPIQGVPVALGLMGAKSASGTVTISDAHTYGIDEMSLMEQVVNYISGPTNASNLLHMLQPPATKDAAGKEFFLNVVTRIFTTGKVAVSVYNESSFGGGLSAGNVNVIMTNLSTTNPVADYSNLVTAVNNIGNSSPTNLGGGLKFTSLSSRSVSLNETFPKPVIIGYLAFSVPITYTNIYQFAYGTDYFDTSNPAPLVQTNRVIETSLVIETNNSVAKTNYVTRTNFVLETLPTRRAKSLLHKVPYDPTKR